MKKTVLLLLIIIGLITSCKTTSNVKCDAYGHTEELSEFDIHAIYTKNNSKFVTTTTIK
jgi:hypothetical protein